MLGFVLVFIGGLLFYLGCANQQLLTQRLPRWIAVVGALAVLLSAGISFGYEYSLIVSLALVVGGLSLTFMLIPLLAVLYARESEAMLLSLTKQQVAELSAKQQQVYR